MIVSLIASLQACSSSDAQQKNTNGVTSQSSGVLLESNVINIPNALSKASQVTQFDYTMNAVTGEITTARAQLFEPIGKAPDQGYPLVVWAHGTTGISNACAPSLSFQNFGNPIAINGLLELGYAVLAPDYEGFGTPTIHPYYLRSSHADAVLASIPAAHQVNKTKLSNEWAVIGHSQGGHVALAAARAEHDPSFPLKAVIALAPGTDLKPLSDKAFAAIDKAINEGNLNSAAEQTFYLNVYGVYVAHAIKLVIPSLELNALFGAEVADIVDQATDESTCGDYARSVQKLLAGHLRGGGSLENFGGLRRDWHTLPALTEFLKNEEFGDEAQVAPLLIIQGDADHQIPVAATTEFVNKQRELGTDVTYEIIKGARHRDVALDEFSVALDWLTTHFAP